MRRWLLRRFLNTEENYYINGADVLPPPLTAEEERVVDNLMHDRYCELRAAAGHPCEGGKPLVIEGAYHEILFEKDAMRSVALNAIVEFFNRHT